jgi:cytochrome c oxidase subunit 2
VNRSNRDRSPRRVLIASSHPLFGQGLRSLLQAQKKADVEIVGVVANLEEATKALERLSPDLVIVDYDDKVLNRDEFLARFVEGEKKLRVVLLSLQGGEEALVYDRRTMAASQIDDWLKDWTYTAAQGVGRSLEKEKSPEYLTNRDPLANTHAESRRGEMKHLVIAGILVVLVTALLIFGLGRVSLLPVAASAQAQPIDWLFGVEFRVIAFLFSLIIVLMLYSIIVFRRKRGDTTDARHIEGNSRLEVMWTLAPLATVLVFAVLGGRSLAETQRMDPRALEVNVIGSQWSWRFEYPSLGITSTDLILPLNKQALLHLQSTDVIHSFWVPEFRVKQDALPGGENFIRDLRVTATLAGDYKVRCAELCGLRHAYMEAPVKVLAQTDYDAWVAANSIVSGTPAERGQKFAQQFGCLACHSIDGSPLVGPTWKGVYGHTVTLSDGTTVTVDDAYLTESIRNPGVKIVQGFADIMPHDIAKNMTDEQIKDVIEFIKTLK